MNNIEVKNLVRSFGDKVVLKDVSLTINRGEIFGLLGPSGAGKTTLIKILTGQISSSAGSAVVLGEDSSHLSKNAYQQMGMVLDNSGLYERLSCYDNLLLYARIYGIRRSKIYEVLEHVGLSGAIKTAVQKLSKGMKQRLVFARAILHEPKLLFLDEPTSGLDPATTNQIHELMNELRKSGTTIFLTTHNMEEAKEMCDHIALLNEGKIVEYGVPEELCRKYNQKNNIQILCKNGEIVNVQNVPEKANVIAEYFAKSLVETIHSSEPDLQEVFMILTGRGLE